MVRRAQSGAVTHTELADMLSIPPRLVMRMLRADAAGARPFFRGAWMEGETWYIPRPKVERWLQSRLQPHYSVAEVAALYGVSPRLIRARLALLPEGEQVLPHQLRARLFFGTEWRISESELLRLEAGEIAGVPHE